MSTTASQRALLYLYKDGGRYGVSCFDVGNAVWPDRVIHVGRGVSVNGGGDYAAQMLLGRLKKSGLVEYAPSEGSTRWCLSTKGHLKVRGMLDASAPRGALTAVTPVVARGDGTDPCACGHAPEEHGNDPEYPGSTSCTECDCIAYEADSEASGAST